MDTAGWYRAFGVEEARGESACYERLSLAVAEDRGLLALIDTLPEPKRQPNLLYAAVRYLGGPVGDPAAFGRWTREHWTEVSHTVAHRRTQTNEPGRCAVLLPVLARFRQPLALLEVGASAGLCLYPDRYRYHYGDHTVGPADSPVRIDCAVTGDPPLPDRVPAVVWRAGLDLNPLDVTDADDVRWLEALVWPEQEHRRARLRAAAGIARADPPHLVRGDLLADLPALAAEAPAGATLVVFHSSVLPYAPEETRAAFAELVTGLPGHWISNERAGVAVPPADGAAPPGDRAEVLLALDGRPLGYAAPHGQRLRWLPGDGAVSGTGR